MRTRFTGHEQPKILAIDPGARMGWAAELSSGDVFSGMVHHKGSVDQRLGNYLRWLRDRLPKQAIIIERPQGLRGRAIDSMYGMLGITRALAHDAGIQLHTYAPKHVKLAATGDGNASKDSVQDAVEEYYGTECDTDDEADALAILWTYHWEEEQSTTTTGSRTPRKRRSG